jgi:hypothetical protein
MLLGGGGAPEQFIDAHRMHISLFVYAKLGKSVDCGPIALVPTSLCKSMHI